MLEVAETGFSGLLLIKPKVHGDNRGYFFESYNEQEFKKHGIACEFVQDNQSFSNYGTIRGLHFQTGEHAQSKLVRVLSGKILDVAVDLRKSSPTFGKVYSAELTSENFLQLFVPRGFAHGFSVLSETATISYKCDRFYAPGHEGGILCTDSDLGIDWGVPTDRRVISPKDLKLPSWHEVKTDEKVIGHWR